MNIKCKNPYLDSSIDGKSAFLFGCKMLNIGLNITDGAYGYNKNGAILIEITTKEMFDDLTNKEVSIYEFMPECVPDGMRYNKELDKLVPDVIEDNDLGIYKKNSDEELIKIGIEPDCFKNQNNEYSQFLIANEHIARIDLSNDLQDILESDMKYGDKIRAIRNTPNQVKEQITPHYYGETCLCGRKIDWYVIGDLYRKNKGSAWDHAGKKLLRAGEGHKTLKEDIKEVINSLTRWLEQIEDKEKANVK